MAMLPEKSLTSGALDPLMCFDLWIELGSLPRVVNRLAEMGIYSTKTGRKLTIFGVRQAAYRWMYENITEAYRRCQQAGSPLSLEEFRRFVLYRYVGGSMAGNKRVAAWLKANDFYDPTGEKGYRRIYERKFGRIHLDGDSGDLQVPGQMRTMPSPLLGDTSPGATFPITNVDKRPR